MAGSSVFIGYLYFVQGIVLSLPAVLPLTYKELPGYSVLSLFAAAWLPFSFKFISGMPENMQRHSLKLTLGCIMGAGRHG